MKTAINTEEQFLKEASKRGFHTFAEFSNVFTFMDYCYSKRLTKDNSAFWTKPDGSGCIIAY